MEREGEYLRKMNISASSFSSEEEKLLYLVNHIHEIDTYYYLASDLSKIKDKSIEFKEALKRKIIQCFIHCSTPGKYTGILTGIFENSPDIETEYLHFLEKIVAPNSVFLEIDYLKSIALSHLIESGSLLFSIRDKVELLAYKYLLKIDPNHQAAVDFFVNYSRKITVSRGRLYFIVIENVLVWSGDNQ